MIILSLYLPDGVGESQHPDYNDNRRTMFHRQIRRRSFLKIQKYKLINYENEYKY